jgi:BASS family bile acid:Na+ symporter
MTAAQIIMLAIAASMAVIVFCLGLQSRLRDVTGLLEQPGLLARSLLSMYVIVPFVVAALCAYADLNHALEAALIMLSLSPVPPILPGKERRVGGDAHYAIGLLAVAALVAIVFVPLAVTLLGRIFGYTIKVPMTTVAHVVATSILVPLAAGFLVRWLAPALALRIARPLSIVGWVVLVAACIPVLIGSWRGMFGLIGNYSLVAVVGVAIVGLLVGHVLGGPHDEHRTVLALSTATRHPGMALAIAHAVAPDEKVLPAAVLLAFLVSFVVTMPYTKSRKRMRAQAEVA